VSDDFQLYAVYDADGTLAGELSYLVGKLRGMRACALCDISHGWNPVGKKAWRDARQGARAVVWLHRDEQPEVLRKVTEGQLPAVVLVKEGEAAILLDAVALQGCAGDFAAFEALLEQYLVRAGVAN
jgi:hypothetical protein